MAYTFNKLTRKEKKNMAFFEAHFFSKTLNVASTVNVIIPEENQGIGLDAAGKSAQPKVLYLLHGYSDDHTIWMRRTNIERYAANCGLAVIMPAVNHSFYLNEANGERYWDYVSEELPQLMHRFFHLSNRSEDTFVAGLSMGGYGAMKLALTYPERFAAAGCFSGMVDMAAAVEEERRGTQLSRLFADPSGVKGSDADLFSLMKRHADAPKKPKLFVTSGTADFLYSQYQRFVPALKQCGWDVTSQEKKDATHEWGYWDEMIRQFISLYCQ